MKEKQEAVRVYALHTGFLEDETVFQRKLQQVTRDRYEKIQACKVKEEKKRSLAAGILLDAVLHKKGYGAHMVKEEEGGRPYLYGVSDCYFSISHSGEYAVCALASVLVGIDIQQKKQDGWKLAERFFRKEEAERIRSLEGEEREDLFFRYWTGKESYLKLTGKGIKGGLDSFLVDFEKNRILDSANPRDIFLKEYRQLKGYCICVSSYCPNFAPTIEEKM